MLRKIRARLSYANVMATIAVFIAIGGGAYAAVSLPRNSVGTRQLKRNAVVSSKVRDRSLLAHDFKKGQLPRGPRGLQGIQGLQGLQGLQGEQGPPGEAVAYARVAADGTLEPGDSGRQNKNVVDANLQHDGMTGNGVYCFGGLPFTPASAMASPDSAMDTTSNTIASVAIQRGNNLGGCDATHQQARVTMVTVSNAAVPTKSNHRFFIWFEATGFPQMTAAPTPVD